MEINQNQWDNIQPKTKFDEAIKKKLNLVDYNGDGVTEKALKDADGNIIGQTYVKFNDISTSFNETVTGKTADATTIKTLNDTAQLLEVRMADTESRLDPDFLMVDFWSDAPGDAWIKGQITFIYNDLDNPNLVTQILKFNGVDNDVIAGNESNPFVPISQTTIFIHPTTFERYKFNGTAMVVYNDVNGIVPKWLEYEALLTQSGTDNPVARVLNQDDVSFFNIDFSLFTHPGDGLFVSHQGLFDRWFATVNLANNTAVSTGLVSTAAIDDMGSLVINTWYTSEGGPQGADEIMYLPHHLEVKKRLRGAPPKLISAETNTLGDKVILTFDKKMSEYGLNSMLSENTPGIYSENFGTHQIEILSATENTVIINLIELIQFEEQDVFFYLGTLKIESIDYGLLQPFENFPVTNNVSESTFLIDGVKDTNPTLTFNKLDTEPMLVVWSDGEVSGTIIDEGFVSITKTNAVGAVVTASVRCSGNYELSQNCASPYVKEVVLDEQVTTIGDGAFVDCSALTSVTIPDSVTSIGTSAFTGCYSLTSVTIPDSVTTLGDYAFAGCDSLTSITIPDSVTTIGVYAFSSCDSLTSITIPDSVTTIGYAAFAGCYSLTSITIPDSVTTIGDGAFDSCASLTSITIPDSVTTIGDGAFDSCSALTSVTIPDSVTTIGDGAFSSCASLTSVTIPDSVTTIGYAAFSSCASLTSVTIGNSVTSIGTSAFSGCYSLTSVYSYPSIAPSVNEFTFDDNSATLHIKAGSTGYDAAPWTDTSKFALIIQDL